MTGLGIRLVDIPTATAADPRARTYIIDHLAPGATIHRRIEVSNGTRSPAHVLVYPAGANVTKGGFVGAAGHTTNQVSSWTTITPQQLVLAPRQRGLVNVTIRVPARAVTGEQYGVVWAQVTTPPHRVGGVTQVSRVGIRLYLSIGSGGDLPSDFTIVSLTAARTPNNAPEVQANIRNTGQRALDLSGTLTLTHGPGGLSAGPFPIPLGTTLGIGDTEPLNMALNRQLPNGPWQATITVVSGLNTRTGHATLTFPSGPGTAAAVPARTPTNPNLGWLIAAAALALLLLLLALGHTALTHRRSSDRPTIAALRRNPSQTP